MNVVLFDYGTGNLHSLAKALAARGAKVRIGSTLDDADALVLPGVGAFGAAARRLAPCRGSIRDAAGGGLPVLGICLGMQLLADSSEEGPGIGLGLIPGRVRRLRARRVPHMGWNRVGARDFYFANSYVVEPEDPGDVVEWAEHEEDRFPAIVRRGGVLGVQFHPEKSAAAGLDLIDRFLAGAR